MEDNNNEGTSAGANVEAARNIEEKVARAAYAKSFRLFQTFLTERLDDEVSESLAGEWNALLDSLMATPPWPAHVLRSAKVALTKSITITATVDVVVENTELGVYVETQAEVEGTYLVPRDEDVSSIGSRGEIDASGDWEFQHGTDISDWLDEVEDGVEGDWEFTFQEPSFSVKNNAL